MTTLSGWALAPSAAGWAEAGKESAIAVNAQAEKTERGNHIVAYS
ncbi:MAG TPA: hypothetical protein VIM02_11255 [Rhizomicrobium sp.]|jgi:hypothetical protein